MPRQPVTDKQVEAKRFRRHHVQYRIKKAQNAALAEAWETLRKARLRRYHPDNTDHWVRTLKDWCACQWHRELDYKSFSAMATAVWFGDRDYWAGWEVMATIVPPSRAIYKQLWWNRLGMQKLGVLRTVITKENWKGWCTLAMHLTKTELRDVTKAWRDAQRTGYYKTQDLIFVPLWVPEGEYMEAIGDTEGPAWEAIKAHFQETPNRQWYRKSDVQSGEG